MSRIGLIGEDEASETVQAIYKDLKKKRGVVPNLYRALAHRPKLLKNLTENYENVYEEGRLGRATKEMIAYLVSVINQSQYCSAWHQVWLRQSGVDAETVGHLSRDYRRASITDKQKAILGFTEKITKLPFAIEDRDVELLKRFGMDDEEIMEVTTVASLANADSRMVLALGIDFER